MAKTRLFIFVLVASMVGFVFQDAADAASCEALVGKWAWFIGGEVTVNADGTFTQQSGNAGTWACDDAARGRFTFRWRDGGFVNSIALSPDGQGLSSTDQSQWYVTARRTALAPTPPLVRKEDCCQEAYGCETKQIEAAFEAQLAQCHHPGNAACIKEAVSTKAEQLKAVGEKLRLCNRVVAGEGLPPIPGTGSGAGNAVSNDEFHSTERPGFFSSACVCDVATGTASAGGDTFGSNSPGTDKGQPVPSNPPAGPLPWEQPAQAKSPDKPFGTVSGTITWDSNVDEDRETRTGWRRLRIHRQGTCTFSIEFYADGKAIAKNFTYNNIDKFQEFPDKIEVELVSGRRDPFQFASNIQLVPIGNGNYDISWNNPTIPDSVQTTYAERLDGSKIQQAGGAPYLLYTAYCIGRNPGSMANLQFVTARLKSVPLESPPTVPGLVRSMIVGNLQKRVEQANINMQWDFSWNIQRK